MEYTCERSTYILSFKNVISCRNINFCWIQRIMPNYANCLAFFAPSKLIWIEFFISVVLFFNFLGIVFWYVCSFMIKSKFLNSFSTWGRIFWGDVYIKVFQLDPTPFCFSKNVFFREDEGLFFVSIIIIHGFPEKFIKISQVVQKIRRFSLSILIFFVTFLDFLAFPCYRETNGVSRKQMASAFLPSTYFKWVV